ncbi:LysR family transcriptional regulator [Thioclava litoralis]|uniref:LysR family transcriptional regulator n=1 Tax=Thioclava litoralis TaxID=3076557 RepID=A0ABZ1DYW7_9RHOB|nr:LysR family transcriptional regulator [Thioclava sp. FTW29]
MVKNAHKAPLSWDDLRFFLELVRAGSLMAAAARLSVEHSTVARRISGLEAALGLRLFDRLPRGWQPTSNATRLIARAEAVEREILALGRSASSIDELKGEVRISAPPVLLALLVAPGLARLGVTHPGIVPIMIGARRASDLDRAEADIALRLGPVSGLDLIVRKLGNVPYGLYGRQDQIERPAAERVYIGFDDSMPDLPQAVWLEEYVRKAGARIGVRSNDMATLLESARAGNGIAMLPCFAATEQPELTELPCNAPFEARPLHLVMHPDIRRAPRVRLVADRVAEHVRRQLDQNR